MVLWHKQRLELSDVVLAVQVYLSALAGVVGRGISRSLISVEEQPPYHYYLHSWRFYGDMGNHYTCGIQSDKLSTRQLESAYSDSEVFKEVCMIPESDRISKGTTNIKLDNAIGITRNRSVGWIVKQFTKIWTHIELVSGFQFFQAIELGRVSFAKGRCLRKLVSDPLMGGRTHPQVGEVSLYRDEFPVRVVSSSSASI